MLYPLSYKHDWAASEESIKDEVAGIRDNENHSGMEGIEPSIYEFGIRYFAN